MKSLHVKLAEELFEIQYRSERLPYFFKDYISEDTGGIPICAASTDIERIRRNYRQMETARGEEPHSYSEGFYEQLALHEQIAHTLVKHGVLLVHGSAVCVDGEAYLFTARSGVGKSTHTALWKEHFGERAFWINDDKPFLKPTENGVTVYGSPWSGAFRRNSNTSAPLKALIQLERGEKNMLRKISVMEMLPELMKASLRGETPAETKAVITLENRILSSVPLFSLTCNISDEAVRVCYGGINGNLI